MIRIALVDDNQQDISLMEHYIEQYKKEKELTFEVHKFYDGITFLEQFNGKLDIIFMDIEMPHLNGIEVAKKLRSIDASVALIFVTYMPQYALQGYEVSAIDYMVKPIGYFNFADKFSKAINFYFRNNEGSVILRGKDTLVRLKFSEIFYIMKDKNYIVFHTAKGIFRERGAMAELAKKFENRNFAKCTAGCLVNLNHVTEISNDTVWVGTTALPLARLQKKEFMLHFLEKLGGIS